MLAVAIAVLGTSACTTNLQKLDKTQLSGDQYSQELAKRYQQLATFEERSYDWPDSSLFAKKGLKAAHGTTVPPEDPDKWRLKADKKPELREAHMALEQVIASGAQNTYPELVAHAQVNYDCWVEQQAEGWQLDHIASCRDAYRASMQRINQLRTAQAQPPATGVRVGAEPETVVHFAFDSDRLEPAQRDILQRFAQRQRGTGEPVVVIGRADRAGPTDYNVNLSQRRAASVRQALIQSGIGPNQVRIAGRGEYDPPVQTADGVPLRANRNATVDVGQQALSELNWTPPAGLAEVPQRR